MAMVIWSGDFDELPDQQAIVKLEREFPGWQCFRGANLMTYGRTHDSPNELVRGEDWTDLRDEIRRAIARSEQERWASSPTPGEPGKPGKPGEPGELGESAWPAPAPPDTGRTTPWPR